MLLKGNVFMSIKLFRLNFKLIFRSLVYWLFIAVMLGGYVFFTYALQSLSYYSNYVYFFDSLTYMDATMYVLLFCVAMFFSQHKTTLEDVCFVPPGKTVCVKFLSVLACSSLICVIPLLFMLFAGLAEKVGAVYMLVSIIYGVVRWLVIIIISQTAGFFIGYVVRSVYSYLFAIPFAILNTFLNKYMFQWIFGYDIGRFYKYANFFSTQHKYSDGMPVTYRGPVVDTEFFVKSAVAVFLLITVFFIILQLARKKVTLKPMCAASASAVMLVLLSVFYFRLHPEVYYNEQKLYITDYEEQPYEITSYSGDISLKEWAEYDVAVGVKGTGDADSVTLRLDESLDIKSLEIGGRTADFERNGDLLTVHCTDSEFVMELCCRGRISYVNSINVTDIYTDRLSCALPPDFAFLPKVDGDKSTKRYELDVKCANTLVSNLDTLERDGVYKISGSAENICFFSGFLTQTERDGITFYHAKYDILNDIERSYKNIRENSKVMFDHEKNSFTEKKWDEKPKVFIITYFYGTNGFAAPYEDYVMMNFGYCDIPRKSYVEN